MKLTQNELETVIWRTTMMVLGLDPNSTEQSVQKQVRLSWPVGEGGHPDWKRDESTTFIRVAPSADGLDTTKDISYTFGDNGGIEHFAYYTCYEVNWIIYGDTAQETADTLRIGAMRQHIREYLAENNLAFISVDRPVRSSEQDADGYWWNRFDLQARIYELAHRDYSVGDYIGVTPNIITGWR